MLREIAKQSAHPRKIGAIDQVASLLLDADQAGVGQFLQMEGQRVARDAELFGQHAGHEPGHAGHDQRAKGPQALGMGKGAQGGNGLIFVHDSIIQRLLNYFGCDAV